MKKQNIDQGWPGPRLTQAHFICWHLRHAQPKCNQTHVSHLKLSHQNYTTTGCACGSTTKSDTWFININIVCDSDKEWLNLRSAWLINLACIAMWASPISPSSSPLGTRAATCHWKYSYYCQSRTLNSG